MGVPNCPDCGTQMQQMREGRWRCPFTTSVQSREQAPDTSLACARPMRREAAGMSGHFLGSSDMRQARS